METVNPEVAAVMRQVAELPDSYEIRMEQHLKDDLRIDSLALIDVVAGIEEEFDIDLGDDIYPRLLTVGDVMRYVEQTAARL